MHPKALLDACSELVRLTLKFDHPADSIVSRFFRDHKEFGPRERATLAETVYTVLRKKLLFDHFAPSGSGPKERRLAILGFHGPRDFLKSALTDQEKNWLDQCDQIGVAALEQVLGHAAAARRDLLTHAVRIGLELVQVGSEGTRRVRIRERVAHAAGLLEDLPTLVAVDGFVAPVQVLLPDGAAAGERRSEGEQRGVCRGTVAHARDLPVNAGGEAAEQQASEYGGDDDLLCARGEFRSDRGGE